MNFKSEYLAKVYADVEKRNAGEKEFLQAVGEVLESLEPVVERRPDARDGEIVAALLEEEATVKRFFQEKDGFRFQPENDDYPPIYTKELVILGKVIAVIRDRL